MLKQNVLQNIVHLTDLACVDIQQKQSKYGRADVLLALVLCHTLVQREATTMLFRIVVHLLSLGRWWLLGSVRKVDRLRLLLLGCVDERHLFQTPQKTLNLCRRVMAQAARTVATERNRCCPKSPPLTITTTCRSCALSVTNPLS